MVALGLGLALRDGLAVLLAHVLAATAVAVNVGVVAAVWQLGGDSVIAWIRH